MSLVMPAALTVAPESTLEDRAHSAYQADFGPNCPLVRFQAGDVKVSRRPHLANPAREHTYWHTVTFGFPEATRTTPDQVRLTRVPWLRPIIAGWAGSKIWWEPRESSIHWNIWHTGRRHVIIVKELADGHYLLKTGYPTDFDVTVWHRRYAEAKKTRRTLSDAP